MLIHKLFQLFNFRLCILNVKGNIFGGSLIHLRRKIVLSLHLLVGG